MRVLLLVDYNPEKIVPYLIENPTEEQLRVLDAVSNTYFGSDATTEEMLLLGSALSEKEEYCREEDPEEWKCVWANTKTTFPVSNVDSVILYGICI